MEFVNFPRKKASRKSSPQKSYMAKVPGKISFDLIGNA